MGSQTFGKGSVQQVRFSPNNVQGVVTYSAVVEVENPRAPALKGRTAVVVKDDAMELLETEDGDPLLAFWPIGLGRTAVFASDVKDRWATDWIRWKGYGPFFTSIVRAIAEAHGGRVELHSGARSGATFTIVVPVEQGNRR